MLAPYCTSTGCRPRHRLTTGGTLGSTSSRNYALPLCRKMYLDSPHGIGAPLHSLGITPLRHARRMGRFEGCAVGSTRLRENTQHACGVLGAFTSAHPQIILAKVGRAPMPPFGAAGASSSATILNDERPIVDLAALGLTIRVLLSLPTPFCSQARTPRGRIILWVIVPLYRE